MTETPGIIEGFGEDWDDAAPLGRYRRQHRGPIKGALRNSQLAPPPIVSGIPPNRAARRWYQKTVTKRGDRLHLVLFGGWRKHDTRQMIRHRASLLAGENDPGDGLTRRERRAAWLETYRVHRKNRSRRVTPDR